MTSLRVQSLTFLLLVGVIATLAQVNPPVFIEPSRKDEKFYMERRDIEIKCQADGQPTPTYKWWKDGKPIIANLDGDVDVDEITGTLSIRKFTSDRNGHYMCVATSEDANDPTLKATSFSPVLHVMQNHIERPISKGSKQTMLEYSYLMLHCNATDSVGLGITHKWYYGEQNDQITEMDNGRLFVDTLGNLHFTFLRIKDSSEADKKYHCGVSSPWANAIFLGAGNEVKVNPVPAGTRIPYSIKYTNSPARVQLHTTAILECVYGGYDPANTGVPVISWFDNRNRQIVNDEKYTISADYRQLTIKEVTPEDEGQYMCQAKDTPKTAVILDLYSEPYFQSADDEPIKERILPEGKSAPFRCNAVSLQGEPQPDAPVWFINGKEIGTTFDHQKHVLSNDKKTLTVADLRKPKDTQCIQCKVTNSIGTIWAGGCITVIKAINIRRQPEVHQEIEKGDPVDFTVLAVGDETTPQLTMLWTFKNQTYTDQYPPYVTVTATEQFINTTELTEEEYQSIAGTYHLEIRNAYDSAHLHFEVVLVDEPPPAPVVQSAGFPMWIIPVILAVLLLILIIIIIICVVCRKKQEGDYYVGKKETGAGLDPEKELKSKGFNDFSRPDDYDYDYPDKPRRDIPYEEDALVPEEEDSGDELDAFKENGSFIGEYAKTDRSQQRESNVSNV